MGSRAPRPSVLARSEQGRSWLADGAAAAQAVRRRALAQVAVRKVAAAPTRPPRTVSYAQPREAGRQLMPASTRELLAAAGLEHAGSVRWGERLPASYP